MSRLTCVVLCSLMVVYASAQCPSPWVAIPQNEGFCYYHYFFPVSWTLADAICKFLEGGDLASIDENAEGRSIYEYWSQTGTNVNMGYWVGLSDIHGTGFGTRKWTDWTSLQGKTNWQGGAPPTNTSDNCVYVANEGASDQERQQWRATSCTGTDALLKPAICERKLVITN